MNPWMAQIENQGLQWMCEHGRVAVFDAETDVCFPRPALVLEGTLARAGEMASPGALLGCAAWILARSDRRPWRCDGPVTVLELPFGEAQMPCFAVALCVAMCWQARMDPPDTIDARSAAVLKFRYVLHRFTEGRD